MPDLPTGTVTFLFTDIEGSTRLSEQYREQMPSAQARHDALLRAAISAHQGHIFRLTGDGVCCVFSTAVDAAAAAVAGQMALAAEDWGDLRHLRVRMALHTGTAELREGDYFGLTLNRVARLRDAGHGGQVLASEATAALLLDALPEQADLQDLGVHRLRDLQRPERVFQVRYPLLPTDLPPLRTLDALPTNLPAQPTAFIGRQREIARLRELLLRPDVRLITLTGPGGTGKTRLALQLGADLLSDFRHGVWFVALDAIQDPALVASSIARALSVPADDGQLHQRLRQHLEGRALLLVLDNFEHVADAATVISELLAACLQLKILVTSRVVLRLAGEHGFTVPPLTLPDPERLPPVAELSEFEAIRLFIDRAQAATGNYALTRENAHPIARICKQLDGLPLAIELAAARSRLFPARELMARLEQRLPLLTGGAKDLPARQRTLRSTLAWSHALLDPAEQILFRRLAVFVGGCTFRAVESVSGATTTPLDFDITEGLDGLIGKSLLRSEEQGDGAPRFQMLETIREYALEQLEASGEADAARRVHAEHYLAEAKHLERAQAKQERLELEHENIRAALRWLLDRNEAEPALELATAISGIWYRRGLLTEGRAWLRAALALCNRHEARCSGAALSEALAAAANLARYQLDYTAARRLLQQTLELNQQTEDWQARIQALCDLGAVMYCQGDDDSANSALREALSLARRVADDEGIALALTGLGLIAHRQDDYSTARSLLEESVRAWRRTRRSPSPGLAALGFLALDQHDYATARAAFEQIAARVQSLGSGHADMAVAGTTLGALALSEGNVSEAAALFARSLDAWQATSELGGISTAVLCLAEVAAAQGLTRMAARLAGAAEALREAYGTPMIMAFHLRFERTLERLRRQLCQATDDVVAATWADARTLSPERALSEAMDMAAVDVGSLQAEHRGSCGRLRLDFT